MLNSGHRLQSARTPMGLGLRGRVSEGRELRGKSKWVTLEIRTGVQACVWLNNGLVVHKRKLLRLDKKSSLRSN